MADYIHFLVKSSKSDAQNTISKESTFIVVISHCFYFCAS